MPRISEFNPTAFPSLEHEFPAEKDGENHRLSVDQVRALMQFAASEISTDWEGLTVQQILTALETDKAEKSYVDTELNEILDALSQKADTTATANALAKRVRVDIDAGFTDAEKAQARANIGFLTGVQDATKRTLLYDYGPAQLGGAQILTQTIPAGYHHVEIETSNVCISSGSSGNVNLRLGTDSVIYAGEGEYRSQIWQAIDDDGGASTVISMSAFGLCPMGPGDMIHSKTFIDLARAGGEVLMNHQAFGRYESTSSPTKTVSTLRHCRFTFIPSPITRVQLFWDAPLAARGILRIWGIK